MNTQDQVKNLTDLVSSTSLSGSGMATPHIDPNLSSISKLNHDILLQIFQINADMDHDILLEDRERIHEDSSRAINITRNSSQVNSLWRNLIIDVPIFWASLIDIDSLDHSCDWWRKEVVRRTGDCPLRIKVSISLASLDNSEPWWLASIRDNWPRVRKIDIDVRSGVTEDPWLRHLITLDYAGAAPLRKVLPFLSQSSPALEYFCLSLPYLCDPLESNATLFNDHAPQLVFFEIHNMRFNLQNTQLPRLRILHVHRLHAMTFENFEAEDALCQAISQMPNLESLSLEDINFPEPSIMVNRNPINLPHLQHLTVKEMLWNPLFVSTIWPLLDCIIPKPGCSIELYLSPSYAGKIDVRVLSRLTRNYFQVNQPTTLDILYNQHRCVVADNEGALGGTGQATLAPLFSFASFVQPESALGVDGVIYQAFQPFFGLSFTQVTNLCLEVAVSKDSLLSCPQLADLLSTFSSVTRLTTTFETLNFLCESPIIDVSALFPELKILKIPVGGFQPYFDSGPLLATTMTRFFNSRKEVGLPIDILHYQSSWENQTLDDLTFLDVFAGLKVVWRTKTIGDGSYICGSGKPEELDFVNKIKLKGAQERIS